ncbi:hypothetical protein O9929_05600 [Vibrio lentus]|nr:hypothetical protein [Vibrio lentus]
MSSRVMKAKKLVSNCFTLSVLGVCVLGGRFNCSQYAVIDIYASRRVSAVPNSPPLLLIPVSARRSDFYSAYLNANERDGETFLLAQCLESRCSSHDDFALLEAGYGIDGVLISSAVSSVLLMKVCLVLSVARDGNLWLLPNTSQKS